MTNTVNGLSLPNINIEFEEPLSITNPFLPNTNRNGNQNANKIERIR